jgi:hypothetical protein
MSGARARRAALAVVMAVTAFGCKHDDPAPPPAAAPAPVARVVRVSAIEGKVVRERAGGAGTPLRVGDVLSADDVVRTDEGGSATLDVAGVADVQVAARTQVSIGDLTETLSKVRLSDGRIAATVHGGAARSLQVDAPSSGAVANARTGEFSMLSAGTRVSVATRSGEVVLSARGSSVRIGSGELSVVERDRPPTAPQPIPASLFLKLGATRPTVQRAKTTTVFGATTPGAVVSINGVRVTADGKGDFSSTVPLKEGANSIAVQSADVLGRSERAVWPRVTVDNSAPTAKTKVEW